MESFLTEQLKRLQNLAEQMSSLVKRTAELTEERIRERESVSYGPLSDVKDLRTFSSGGRHARSTADERAKPRRSRRRS